MKSEKRKDEVADKRQTNAEKHQPKNQNMQSNKGAKGKPSDDDMQRRSPDIEPNYSERGKR